MKAFFLLVLTLCIPSGACLADETSEPVQRAVQSSTEATTIPSTWNIKKSSTISKNTTLKDAKDSVSLQTYLKSIFYTFIILGGVFVVVKRIYSSKTNALDEEGIEIVGRKSLGPRTTLLVIRAQGQSFLLAQSCDDVSLLTQLAAQSSFEDSLTNWIPAHEDNIEMC